MRERERERERSHLEPAGIRRSRRPRDDRRGGVEPCSGAHDEAGVGAIEDQVAPGHQDLPRRGRHGTPHWALGVMTGLSETADVVLDAVLGSARGPSRGRL